MDKNMNTYFVSDTHFFHANILKYCNRPFANVDEMNRVMVENWNRVVGKNDIVYHLGDFAFADHQKTCSILDKLNGSITLILGNHDRLQSWQSIQKSQRESGRKSVQIQHGQFEVRIPDNDANRGSQSIVLSHYAMRTWNKAHYKAWQLYGHSHGTLPEDPNSLSFDVGVDCWNYTPVSYAQVKAKMATKNFKPIDHHGND